MKKLKFKEPKDIRIGGRSLVNGISLKLVTKDGDNEIEFPGFTTVIENNGEYVITYEKDSLDKEKTSNFFDNVTNISIIARRICLALSLILFAFAIYMMVCRKDYNIFLSGAFFFYGVSKITSSLACYVLRLMGNLDAISLQRYHAAEHSVINAYYDLRRLPKYEELRKYSFYSYDCGSTKYAALFVSYILLSINHLFFGSPLGFLVDAGIFVLVFILDNMRLLYFVEYFMLLRPTSKEYKVAIEVMKNELERVKEIL